jgi:hypothetical protein
LTPRMADTGVFAHRTHKASEASVSTFSKIFYRPCDSIAGIMIEKIPSAVGEAL